MTGNSAFLLSALLLASVGIESRPGEESIAYTVASVKRKLMREVAGASERLHEGAELESGDLLRTGWLSEADIAAPARGAMFHLAARTRVRLTHGRAGVLLEVNRGRLRAVFEALLGADSPQRVVTTPSAILAVRGTEYGVSVDAAGHTTVVVLAGVVEVVDLARRGEAIELREGFYTTIAPGGQPTAPRAHQLNRRGWDRGLLPASMRRGPGAAQGGMGSGGAMGKRSRGGRGGGGGGGGGGSMGPAR